MGLEDSGIYRCLASQGGRQGEAEIHVMIREGLLKVVIRWFYNGLVKVITDNRQITNIVSS